MSVVVAFKEKDRIIVGCDTRMSSDYDYVDSYYDRPKAYKIKDNTIVASVGNIALLDIFASFAKKVTKIDHEELMIKIVLPMMKTLSGTCMLNGGELDGSLLLAIDDKAAIIESNGTIEIVNSFQAIGSGKIAAMGSFVATFGQIMPGINRVYLAIKTAGELIPSVSKEVFIADTKTMDFHLASFY